MQNLIERAVILANDGVLRNPVPSVAPHTTTWSAARKTVTEIERAIILTALNELDWVIGGTNGAAAKLGLKRTTFLYKMKKLGINRAMRQA
jgi:formate hydrogenlyase transcriptional activator